MRAELSVLPVQCRFLDGESGLGFLLRSAHANGLTLLQLMAAADVRQLTWPERDDIDRLAHLAGVSRDPLSRLLRHRCSHHGRREFLFCGQRWQSVTALRVRALQVCPECLREQGRCRAIWELAGVPLCAVHGRVLVDRCEHCQRVLDWRRPAVDVCRCGRYLRPEMPGMGCPAGVIAWCRWLASECDPTIPQCPGLPDGLDWLERAGPDGAFQILMAFGGRRDARHWRSFSETVGTTSSVEMAECLERGLSRLRELDPDEGVMPKALIDVVDQPRLERVVRNGVHAGGRHVAYQLLRRMRCEPPLELLRRPWRTAPPRKGQLELFDDELVLDHK